MTIYDAKSVVLKNSLDEGMPGPEHFDIVSSEVNGEDLAEGAILIEVKVMSADPYLRGSIKSTGTNHGGKTMVGFVAGKVLLSKSDKWSKDDFIGGSLAFSTFQIVTAEQLSKTVAWKLTGLVDESNISYGIGVLGMPGSTAYGGLRDILRPNEGETIFISAASGAVGALVGQLAKHLYNCKVIGSCGGTEKCNLAKEKFGFDHAIDYKTTQNTEELVAQLKKAAPEGIDMYFENVGGMHFEAAMATLRPHGRVAVCGQISEYNAKNPAKCYFDPMKMIYTFQRIEGFMCFPWLSGQRGEFLRDMSSWLREGKLQVQETFFDGIEQWPNAFQSLFTGSNVGKVVVRV